MLSVEKLKEHSKKRQMDSEQLAGYLVKAGRNRKEALAAVKNWKRGFLKPQPDVDDIQRLANAMSVDVNDLADWRSSYRFAPISPRKARLVAQLITGRSVQDAMDILKYARKRAATMMDKVLKSAVANADEQQADVDNLFVYSARVDDAGIRVGTKRWMAKDRGRAHPIRKKACHIHITVTQL